MATVQNVFDMAIHLMDEQNEQNGATETVDTQEYRFRTISILNSVIPALYPYSGDTENTGRGRPYPEPLEVGSYKDPDFGQYIPLDETLSMALLPYYLAAQLLSGENAELASWFMTRYREAFLDLRSKIPASFEKVTPACGLF